jgi:hypothetical protein
MAADDVRYVMCPYHQSDEPTLAIDQETGRYHCDLCHADGVLTPHGEAGLLLERRGRNPAVPEVGHALRQIGPADEFM